MNIKDFKQIFDEIQSGKLVGLGGLSRYAIPEALKALRGTGQSIVLEFDLSTVEEITHRSKTNNRQSFVFFQLETKATNSGESFLANFPLGTFGEIVKANGKLACVVVSSENKEDKEKPYTNIQAAKLPVMSEDWHNEVWAAIENIYGEQTEAKTEKPAKAAAAAE